jgi:type IX secretion system substrate protein
MRVFFIQILLFCSFFSGQTQNWNWAKGFGGPAVDIISSMKINTSEEILFSGTYNETLSLGSSTLEAIQGSDVFLSKSDNQGNVLWAVSAGSSNNDFSLDIEVDSEGNILWLGQYWVEVYFENDTLQAGSNTKAYFVAKYNPSGQLIWAKSINGSSTKAANDLTLSEENDIYLTGYFNDSLIVDNIVLTAQAAEDAFVLKISADGIPSWGVQFGNEGTTRPQRIETTSSGQLVIAGNITGSVTFGNDNLVSVTTDFDIFVAHLDENGISNWGRIGTGVFDNLVNALAVGVNDNIYVSGNFTGVLGIDNQTIATPGFNENLYLLNLNTTGDLVWIRGLDDQVFNDPSFSYDIALKDELVLMTGQFLGTLIIDDLQLGDVAELKGYIASFDVENGQVKKLSLIPGTAQTSGSRISVDNNGRLYLGGTFTDQVTLGNNTLTSTGSLDFFIAQASPTFTGFENIVLKKEEITISPNPVSENLHLNTSDHLFTIEIFDLYGRQLLSLKNQTSLNVQSLSPGNYFIRYTSSDYVQVIPFIKI